MFFPFHFYLQGIITLHILGASLGFGVALLAWGRSYFQGNKIFSIFMVVLGWWALTYAFELLGQQSADKLFWAKAQYLAIPYVTPLLLLFIAAVSGHKWQSKPHFVAIVLIIPTLTALIIWFRQDWIWIAIRDIEIGGVLQKEYLYGFWFTIHTAYSWVLFLIAFFLLVRLSLTSPSLSNGEAILLAVTILVPFVNNVTKVLGLGSISEYDPTPLLLVTFGLGAAWVLFELRPNNLAPFVYHTAFDNLPDPAMMLDETDCVHIVNPAAETYFSAEAATLVGVSVTELLPKDWLDLLSSAEQQHPNQTINSPVSKIIDDKTHYYNLRVITILDRRKRNKGRLFVIHDTTIAQQALMDLSERGQKLSDAVAEQTSVLQVTNQELERAVQLKDEFLASMSHELRTPLSAVIGTIESLHAGVYGPVIRDQIQPLHRIEDSAKHLLELISDILNVSKIEAGQFTLRVSPVSITILSRACLNLVRLDAERKNITLIVSFEINKKSILIDERRARQILLNLFSNAIKFTPENGKVGLTVSEDKEAQLTYFTVWDTGIGIAKEAHKRIFKPFIQVDSTLARQYEGTGLGLALARGLVEMHGGKIELSSELGMGSRFTVTLPWDSRPTANVPFTEPDPDVQEETYFAL